uniref:Uncharacterized protein n=1 Tax=Hyaloperonospora arabidopsidis (strain Emoy2) TaxID=559515 RepID=M4B2W9_HYAAE
MALKSSAGKRSGTAVLSTAKRTSRSPSVVHNVRRLYDRGRKQSGILDHNLHR